MEITDTIPQDVSEASARRVEGQRVWVGAASVLVAMLLLVQLVVTARALGPADFGVLTIVVALVTVVRAVLTLRTRAVVVTYMHDALVDRDFAYAGAAIKGAAALEIAVSLVALGALVALAPVAVPFFTDDPADVGRALIYAAIIPFGMVAQTSLAVLQYFGRFDVEMLVRAAERVAVLAATGGAVFAGGSLDAFVTAAAIGPCVSGVLLLVLGFAEARKRLGARWHRAPRWAMAGRWKGLVGGSLRGTVTAVPGIVVSREGDPLWVAWLGTPIMAGYYGLASTLGSLLVVPAAPILHAVYPDAARLAAQQRWREMRTFTSRSALLAGGFVALMVLIFAVNGNELLRELFGVAYQPAGTVLLILLGASAIMATTVWARPILLASGRAASPLPAAVAAAAIKVAGVLVLLPAWGITGCAAATAAAMAFGAAVAAARAAWAARVRARA